MVWIPVVNALPVHCKSRDVHHGHSLLTLKKKTFTDKQANRERIRNGKATKTDNLP